MPVENEVLFPRSLRDIYPMAAQELYIETYKQSWATSVAGTRDVLSRESVASRDAWDAVGREFTQDAVTRKWRRISDIVAPERARTGKRSMLVAIRGIFRS